MNPYFNIKDLKILLANSSDLSIYSNKRLCFYNQSRLILLNIIKDIYEKKLFEHRDKIKKVLDLLKKGFDLSKEVYDNNLQQISA